MRHRFLLPRPARLLLATGCVFMIGVLAWYTATRAEKVTHGYAMYYTYARMLLTGEDLQKIYDYDYFNAKIKEYGINNILDMPNNIPTNTLFLLPLAWMTPQHTKIALSAISFVALLLSLSILLRLYEASVRGNLGMILTILFLAWSPIYDNVYLGQIYAILLLLFCLSMFGLVTARSSLVSLPLSFVFLLKGQGLVPILWLAVTKNSKTFLLVVAGIVAIILGTLPFFGIDTWTTFHSTVVIPLGTLPTDAGTSFQTINSFIYHLFTHDPRWLPNPLIILPDGIVKAASYLLNIMLIVYVLRAGYRAPRSARILSFSATIAAGVVTAPLAEEYAFTLFLPFVLGIVAGIASRFQNSRNIGTTGWLCLASVFVLAIPLRYEVLHYDSFPLILLAYPKLFAGITSLVCFGHMMKAGYFDQAEKDPPIESR